MVVKSMATRSVWGSNILLHDIVANLFVIVLHHHCEDRPAVDVAARTAAHKRCSGAAVEDVIFAADTAAVGAAGAVVRIVPHRVDAVRIAAVIDLRGDGANPDRVPLPRVLV